MLTLADRSTGEFIIAVNNSTCAAELMSDFSYIEGLSGGVLTFDFTHMTAPLTQEKIDRASREEYIPRGFGYQPLQYLIEVVCAIAAYVEREAILPHTTEAVLPNTHSKFGGFLHNMGLPFMLRQLGLTVRYLNPCNPEIGDDDTSRQNLIPLTYISVLPTGPDFSKPSKMRK